MGELKDVRQKKGLRMYGGRGGMAGEGWDIYIYFGLVPLPLCDSCTTLPFVT